MIHGDTYKKRSLDQLNRWVNGESVHNDVDNECCPDFSCCNPQANTPIEQRKIFRDLHLAGDLRAMDMRIGFLGASLAQCAPDKHVHIVGSDKIKTN